ncbi:MAG TPA: undecaprenyl-diphosphatase UppP [Candidatus Paceibacterota bacterium]|mgnify:FL=1|jgi:undecaprenyl-diphosphatase|nr:undecaprenyl-diphosphatase UppP [Parcubacteria group bacterium]MDP6119485.1 undecaprenyl-diphosphatase UppP [Candidatus Paceibacterota bacterium]HJN62643.1 undecaprenyl-diphosphatase UppP [Candidatus Paceibacterota bacterium]|tara:strand:+ start:4506 stop:5303 length:798 start_codon:yes stop_codon:yes gene_type:complete
MTILDSIILGAIQGLTEFIPVSSSGHLVIAREFLNINNSGGLAFDAVLHLATALAVLIYFRKEILDMIKTAIDWIMGREVKRESRILLLALILGTIPVVVVAFYFEKFFEEGIRDPLIVASALIAGSLVFWIAEKVAEKNRNLTIRKGLLAGVFQTLALIPGVSRSGITISGGLFMGFNRELATRFSFLLGFPIILGSGLKKLFDLGSDGLLIDLGASLVVGSVVAFVLGYFSIYWMLRYLKNHTLTLFVIYRIVLAVVIFLIVI